VTAIAQDQRKMMCLSLLHINRALSNRLEAGLKTWMIHYLFRAGENFQQRKEKTNG